MQIYIGAITALLVLAACGQPTAQQASAEGVSPADAADKPDAATPGGPPRHGTPPTREQLVGLWGDNGNCSAPVMFIADGSYAMPDGSTGRWTIDGERVTMSGAGGVFTLQVTLLNDHQLLIGNPDGSIGLSQRCQ
jgi:hypothetical protein